MPGTLTVDIQHWLTPDGDLPYDDLLVRRKALRIARFIEYGGGLERLHGRETLLECRLRPKRVACLGFMWVVKRSDDRLEAFCSICHHVEALISGWEETLWAEGMMEPLPMTDG